MTGNKYYTLVGSLPHLPRHFAEAERVPISQHVLQERLQMLTPRHSRIMEEMVDFLAWERQPIELTDESVLQHFRKFMNTVDSRFATDLIQYTMSVRTVLAALRRRRLDLDPPPGIAPLAARIAQHWNHPDFHLGAQFPWIATVDAQLCGDSPFEVERALFEIMWRHAKRLADDHHFDFEAVVLYLIRWELVYRWTRRNADLGMQKFELLATKTMGEFAELFPPANAVG